MGADPQKTETVVQKESLGTCPACGQNLPEPVPIKEEKGLYCAFCRQFLGEYSDFEWRDGLAIDQNGREVILCSHLYHGGTVHLKDGTPIKINGSSSLVHYEECRKYCWKNPSSPCPHNLWNLK